ncbi:MAG: Glutathione S-transferase domain [Microvirga sp.]|jgi:glutathione S-transferase|nr:Glutathione S-transferase domain [Microvirga sp.]
MLTLFHAPRSPFSFKVRILAHELGIAGTIDFATTDPWTDEQLRRFNPLCKVPTLLLSDGATALYDSPVICAYLRELSGRDLGKSAGSEPWEALRMEALADGLAEAVIRRFLERRKSSVSDRETAVRRQEAAIAAALDELDRGAPALARGPTVGAIATAATLIYMRFRSPEILWSDGRERLSAWFEAFEQRPSVAAANFTLPASG